MPPAMISWISPYSPISCSAALASQTATRVGMPVCSCSISGEAPVPPSMPSTTITSAPSLAGLIRVADHRRAFRQRRLGVQGERAPAHAGHHDRYIELNRLCGEPCAEDSLRDAPLTIAFHGDACQGARHEGEMIEGGPD